MNSETLKKILKLRFLLSKKSQRSFSGLYKSAFKGTGLTFRDFREYARGDDVRSICWPLTAKMGQPYVKTFEEDRGNTFILMVDISASSYIGAKNWAKSDVIHQIASLIALASEQNQDHISLLLFSDRVEHYVPPMKGRNHTMRIIKDIYSFKAQSKKTDLRQSCLYLKNILKKKCYIFLISDFLYEDFEQSLRLLRQAHQVTAVIVRDPFEKAFPKLGFIDFEDVESGEQVVVDTSSAVFQREHQRLIEEAEKEREKKLKQAKVDYFYIQTDKDIFKPFLDFMQRKNEK